MTRPTKDPDTRAAIIGIGCRLPGGVHTPGRLWEALLKGETLTGPVPQDRWAAMSERLHPSQSPDRPWTAGLIDDIEAFDHQVFGINAHEAAEMDPQQRMILEVVVEALADAGIAPSSLDGTRTGVWVGSANVDHAGTVLEPAKRVTMVTASGVSPAILANRVSYQLNLRGPSMTVDTACSASATALHLARQSLELGEVDTAIVAGAQITMIPGFTAAFSEAGVLASDGVCRPFDADGDGYVRSEAVAVTVLRRLGDARENADRVYSVVRGSAANSDGRSPAGLYAPNPPAHDDLLRDAYADAGLDPAEVDYVQCHGTGTKAGDSAEGRSLARVLGQNRDAALPIGSVKALLGHGEGAAGLVGVACTALGLYHSVLPPTMHHTRMRPALARLPLRVVTEPEPWPRTGRPRVAGVSTFGFGGSNVHVVLEQAPEAAPAPEGGRREAEEHVIPVSAASESRLAATAGAWAPAVAAEPDLARVAATAQHRRDHDTVRAAVVAATPTEAAAALRALAERHPHPAVVAPRTAARRPGPLVFMFAGHGSQYAGMAERAYERFAPFRAALDEARAALAAALGREPWRPGDPVGDFETAQHAIWLTQVAQSAQWRSWGHRPAAVLGHSLGEVAAAYAAGALSLGDAARVVAARSALLAETAPHGGLLVTDLSPEEAGAAIAEEGLAGALVVAAVNGPETAVVSGAEEPLEALRAALEGRGRYVRRVAHDVPAHSPAVEELLPRLRAALEGLAPSDTRDGTVFHSTVTGGPVEGARLDAEYWVRQLRAPVRFTDALAAAAPADAVVVEVGARSTLSRGAVRTLSAVGRSEAVVIGAATSEQSDQVALLHQFAALHTTGHRPERWPAPAHVPPVVLPVVWQRTEEGALEEEADLPAVLAEDRPDPDAVRLALVRLVADTVGTSADTVDSTEPLHLLGVTSVAVIGLRDAIRSAHPSLASFPVRLLMDSDTDLATVTDTVTGLRVGHAT
ncbi:type I polyketide synthase [Marinitenerispora sediminis]|uniref:type I polyketide synthase n=1 Tax=Marinitenerispora sediminis TaxID=1931232 RepID=UPI0013146FDA|nr:beta-ketoacyl synthase N-terminal-like domain-containing protein [Marinitenerispora sediminis]